MTAIVFPGQGSQFVGMAKDFFDNFSQVKEVFKTIEEITKIDMKKIIFDNSPNLLNQTQYTQLAIFCSSISIYNVLKSEIDIKKFNISTMLGHSLGEYSALTSAGILSIEDCAFLLKKRGELMQNAYAPNKSGMAALIGLNCLQVQEIINQNKLKVEIANDNSPIQIVVSGKIEDVNRSKDYFSKNGLKRFVHLNVSAAFHSKLMLSAEKNMKNYISQIVFKESEISIISNFTGKFSNDLNSIIDNLYHQISNRVRWVESIKTLEKAKESRIIEIGPGRVLSGLIKRISNNFNIENIEKVSDIKKIINEN